MSLKIGGGAGGGGGGGGGGWENVLVSETLNFEIPIDVL